MRAVDIATLMVGDHPREYGENYDPDDPTVTQLGSSPRIRGKWGSRKPQAEAMGIIPANTGKIAFHQRIIVLCGDHPREYGENRSVAVDVLRTLGSSPRIRGKCSWRSWCFLLIRIIPANTGKMNLDALIPIQYRDHPREYGENESGCINSHTISGSSPRIRGKLFCTCRMDSRKRIIPANTGKMRLMGLMRLWAGDHPREYGENME